MYRIVINYDKAYAHNFKTNVQGALRYYLDAETSLESIKDSEGNGGIEGLVFILYPQALNPFLKILETLGESSNIMIFPAYDNNSGNVNKPAYLIMKYATQCTFPETILMSLEKVQPTKE